MEEAEKDDKNEKKMGEDRKTKQVKRWGRKKRKEERKRGRKKK